MRAIFGVLGLLMALAITGILVKKQFSAISETSTQPQTAAGVSVPATTPGATVQQQSQQIQQQVKQSVEAAMQQQRPVPDDK